MPIAGAVAGAVVGIGGAILSSSAQKKAASKAAGAQKDASDANIALARETYDENAQRLDPYANNGLTAGNALMGLLGYGAPPGTVTATGTQGTQQYGPAIPAGTEPTAPDGPGGLNGAIQRALIRRIQGGAQIDPAQLSQYGLADYAAKYHAWKTGAPATGAAPPVTSASALSAWDQFRNSTNYQFRFDQGQRALAQGFGALGAFDSGATRKAEIEYGQNFAANELGTYMDRLAQQQSIGLAGASALAGVSQNMAGSVMASNNASASAIGNAALARGAANQNMYGQIAGALGGLASSWPKG